MTLMRDAWGNVEGMRVIDRGLIELGGEQAESKGNSYKEFYIQEKLMILG